MLNDKFDRNFYLEHLTAGKQPKMFPAASDRKLWTEIFSGSKFHRARKYELLGAANNIKQCPWPQLSATDYRHFIREGNRDIYETPYFMRRNMLATLVLAECISYDSGYMDVIIDGIWTILSEPDWCVPAHAAYLHDDSLPDPDTVRIDLFAAGTGMLLSTTLSLLEKRFQKHSPGLEKRLKSELLNRIVKPIERCDSFHWWLNGTNNWAPWCSSNVLTTALQCIDDRERLVLFILKLQNCVEKFIATYDPDGGCDEGASYWSVAAGMMLMFLEQLNAATGNAMTEIYNEPLIRNMGEYIAKVNFCGKYCMSNADSSPLTKLHAGMTYRYGERTGIDRLMSLTAASIFAFDPPNDVSCVTDKRFNVDMLLWTLADLFWIPSGIDYQALKLSRCEVLPDLQIMVAREANDGAKGFVLSAKGGSNSENHNHNDVGQFELFCNGEPIVIDIGVGIYSRKNFSSERYSILEIGAQGHNVPQVNDFLQENNEFKAKASLCDTPEQSSMTMEISASYPEAANIASLCRISSIDWISSEILITDRIEMKQGSAELTLPLYVHVEPVMDTKMIKFPLKSGEVVLSMENWESVSVEKIIFKDYKLVDFWGPYVYKITLHCSFAAGKGFAALKFKRDVAASEQMP